MKAEQITKITRKQIERWRILDELLQEKNGRYTKQDLLQRVNEIMYDKFGDKGVIAPRTLDNDIRDMRSLLEGEQEIEARHFDGHKQYLHYKYEGNYLFTKSLSTDELADLQQIVISLAKYRNIDEKGRVDRLLRNIENKIGSEHYNRAFSRAEETISFEQESDLQGLQYLDPAIDAAHRHKKLVITYHPYGKEPRLWHVHPWYVKQYNRRWYLIGKVDEISEYVEITNMALDRIESLAIDDAPAVRFQRRPDNFLSRFNSVIGVSYPRTEEPLEEVVLRFEPHRLPYVITKPMHHSQSVNEAERTVTLRVFKNNELTQRILSFGSDVEVLAPEALRQEIKEIINKTSERYL